MGGLAHYLEEEGIATTSVALFRLHAEKVTPPRALWVPFELGRPVGPPGHAGFQTRVIQAALDLLDRDGGPVILDDFPDDAPDEAGDPAWHAPVLEGGQDLLQEVESLRPWYERARARRGYSTVGLIDLPIETIAGFLAAVDGSEPLPSPTSRFADVQLVRFGADELKAFYLEAATAGPGAPSSKQLSDWFWHETVAARTIRALRERSLASDDPNRRAIAGTLVPVARLEEGGPGSNPRS